MASKSQSKADKSDRVSKSGGNGKSMQEKAEARTYNSSTNTWEGNGVTTHSSDGSQSNGSKSGSYYLTREKSAIGFVPVAYEVSPVAVRETPPKSTGSGPGVSGVVPPKAVAQPVATGPGQNQPVTQAPIRLGEINVVADAPRTVTTRGPGVSGITISAPGAARVDRPKAGPRTGQGHLGGPGVLAPAFQGTPKQHEGGYRFTDIGMGLTWATPMDMAPAQDLEDEMGDIGSIPFQVTKLGMEVGINAGRVLNTFDAPITGFVDGVVGGLRDAKNNFGRPSPQQPDYSRRGGGTGFTRPW